MKKKLIITEKQMVSLANHIKEGRSHDAISLIKDELDLNYAPAIGTFKEGGEYFNNPMFEKKIDGEMISAKDLMEYLSYKYKDTNEEFLKQIVRDWSEGSLDDNQLSKNIKM